MNRLNKVNSIRRQMQGGDASIGSWMQIPNSSVAEIMGRAGYDWVAVDMEHGAFNVSQLPDVFRALELGDTLPLARLSQGAQKECKQALDASAGGVIIPMVESAEQLLSISKECIWPPEGCRGVGFSRANLFGKHFDEYKLEAQSPLLIAMIENIRAVDNLDKILEVPGLDAVFIGPYDLSASMGITGELNHQDYQAVQKNILQVAIQHNIACGIHVVKPDKAELNKCINQGYRFIAYSIDSVFLINAAENQL